jgi:predicted amidophosphoribosyltransferase
MSNYQSFRLLFIVLFWGTIGIYALVTVRAKRHYGHHRSMRCPRCKHHFPKLRNEESGKTIPEGGFVCEHCGCKMDEFGNELSFPADLHDPESW